MGKIVNWKPRGTSAKSNSPKFNFELKWTEGHVEKFGRTIFVLNGTANLANPTYLIKAKNIGSPLNLRMAASSSGTRPASGVWFLSRRLGRQEAADTP